jgi:hypothetical protein
MQKSTVKIYRWKKNIKEFCKAKELNKKVELPPFLPSSTTTTNDKESNQVSYPVPGAGIALGINTDIHVEDLTHYCEGQADAVPDAVKEAVGLVAYAFGRAGGYGYKYEQEE